MKPIPMSVQPFVFLFCFGSLVLVFNNCGHSPTSTSNVNQSTADTIQTLSQLHSKSMSADFCSMSANYECLHKVFASHVETGTSQQQVCAPVSGGNELCPQVTVQTYDSSAAQQACQAGCNENYNYEEYECHLKLAGGNGIYPLVVTQASLSEALNQLKQSCQDIQRGGSQ